MNITRNNVDALNAIITVNVAKADFEGNVENALKDYRKNANIPGFRKGQVPMALVKKQYGQAVMLDEVNKLLQDSLNNYLNEEKIDILGNPLPVAKDIDWNADTLSFDFELGLAPEFNVDLKAGKNVTKYQIVADEDMINEQVEYIQKQYGKLVSKEKSEEGDDIRVKVANEEEGIENETTFNISDIRTKTNQKKFIGKKVGDVVAISTKGLFEDEHKLMDVLKVDHDKAHGLDVEVTFTIEEVSTQEKAELNQEFFDKLFGEGKVTSEDELKGRIKEDAEKQFAQQADQKFMNDTVEALVENTKFDLPKEFLVKWLQTAGETELTAAQAEEEYTKSESGLRYQLIEGKIITENDLQIKFDEIKDYTSGLIKDQMAQFGQLEPSEEDVTNIVSRVLSNQEEVKRISEQLMNEKMMQLFADKVSAKTKEVTYKDFVKEVYGE
ncbi:trigger factor [Flavobacterium sp. xlx-214]|uniref:trigger factor n=1 Tax=unclassified Flavobacterium TaxID=196869 RepID=UPI0013D7A803|nr:MULTISPECIES: trigger factor [unclassified Flavobacterium]MBA5792359.1 trigger factor [Flavobacterium sp. xlx-221]QMI82328.1 trigger factor [Flavobacterium sp. xlx-214]